MKWKMFSNFDFISIITYLLLFIIIYYHLLLFIHYHYP